MEDPFVVGSAKKPLLVAYSQRRRNGKTGDRPAAAGRSCLQASGRNGVCRDRRCR